MRPGCCESICKYKKKNANHNGANVDLRTGEGCESICKYKKKNANHNTCYLLRVSLFVVNLYANIRKRTRITTCHTNDSVMEML